MLMFISQLFSSSLVAKQICEKTVDSMLDKKSIQPEEKRSEEMEVRNTVGAGEEIFTFSNFYLYTLFLICCVKVTVIHFLNLPKLHKLDLFLLMPEELKY